MAIIRRLLASLVAADIFSVNEHAWDKRHDNPRIAGCRQAHDHLLGDINTNLSFFGINNWRFSNFFNSRLLENNIKDDISSEGNINLFPNEGLESRQFKFQSVIFGNRETQKPEVSFLRSYGGHSGNL